MGKIARRLVAAMFTFGVPVAGSAAPCAGFTDVDDSSGFCTSIAWMKNRAITLGCTSTQYCPNDFVRRDQMAAFMYRLGFQNAYLNGGNAFGATAVLGTTDNQALDIIAGGYRAVRYEQTIYASPNILGGYFSNSVGSSGRGATIGGGGWGGNTCYEPSTGTSTRSCNNVVDGDWPTVGGGLSNKAGQYATVAGGLENTAGVYASTVGGGSNNIASGNYSTVAGGASNTASGTEALPPG